MGATDSGRDDSQERGGEPPLIPSISFDEAQDRSQDEASIPQHERVAASRPEPERALTPGPSPTAAGEGRTRAPEARKRGGGPKTQAGKAIVRRNPVKHGVLAQTPVIGLVERAEDWEVLRGGIVAYFEVEGTMEEELADRIAGYAWRLRRASRAETGAVAQALHDVPEDWRFERALAGLPEVRRPRGEHVEEMNRMLMGRLMPAAEVVDRIGRYEKSLHRQMLQTIQQLLVLKGIRRADGRRKQDDEGRKGWRPGKRSRGMGEDGAPVSVKGYEARGVNRTVPGSGGRVEGV